MSGKILLKTLSLALVLSSAAIGAETESLQLSPATVVNGGLFGTSVSINGQTALVGAPNSSSTIAPGSAYFYDLNSGVETKVQADDGVPFNLFGLSVALGTSRGVISARGANAAYVFGKNGVQLSKLTGGTANQNYGESVAINDSGNRILVGSPPGFGSGSTFAYFPLFTDLQGNITWTSKTLLPSDGSVLFDDFGQSVSVSRDGQLAAVGADGKVYVYEYDPTQFLGGWTEIALLVGSQNTGFGGQVSIDGDYLAVGAPFDNTYGSSAGAVHVFERDSSGNWLQTTKLFGSSISDNDLFGRKLHVDGDRIIVGAPHDEPTGLQAEGSAFIFEKDSNGNWSETKQLVASDSGTAHNFGTVAVSGDLAVVGAPGKNSFKGGAYLYDATSVSIPAKPTLVSPSGTGTSTPTYTWNAVSGAAEYDLWVNDTATGSQVVRELYTASEAGCSGGSGQCSVTPSTSVGGNAQWWVQAKNSAGSSPWSDSLSFTVGGGVPGQATLISPTGSGTTDPTYTWNAVSDATWYYLWVNDDSGSGTIKQWYTAAQAGCSGGTGTCSTTGPVSVSGDVTWWIRTWNAVGTGPWSSSLSFTTGGPPGQATLIDPTGSGWTANPTYQWNAVSTSTWYYLWVNDASGSGTIQTWYTAASAGCSTGGTCSITPSTSVSGSAVWWIRTWNPEGAGPWSSGKAFSVGNNVNLAAESSIRLLTPPDDAGSQGPG